MRISLKSQLLPKCLQGCKKPSKNPVICFKTIIYKKVLKLIQIRLFKWASLTTSTLQKTSILRGHTKMTSTSILINLLQRTSRAPPTGKCYRRVSAATRSSSLRIVPRFASSCQRAATVEIPNSLSKHQLLVPPNLLQQKLPDRQGSARPSKRVQQPQLITANKYSRMLQSSLPTMFVPPTTIATRIVAVNCRSRNEF